MMRASLGLRWMRDMARTGQSGRRTVDARRATVNPESRPLCSVPGPPLPVAGTTPGRSMRFAHLTSTVTTALLTSADLEIPIFRVPIERSRAPAVAAFDQFR